MNDHAWMAYLDTLPPDLSDLAQHVLERVNTVLNRDRSLTLDEAQRIERRLEVLQRHIEAIDVRLDEQPREREVGA